MISFGVVNGTVGTVGGARKLGVGGRREGTEGQAGDSEARDGVDEDERCVWRSGAALDVEEGVY